MALSLITYNPYVKVIDLYFSKIIQNPTITCGIVLILFSIIQVSQVREMYIQNHFEFIFEDDYWMDILSNFLNILFIIRFSTNYYTNIVIELAFMVMQNLGYCYLLTSNYSLLSEDHQKIMIFVIFFHIACSYTIFMSNMFDVYCGNNKLIDALKNSNNNFLPLLLIQSFLLVNITFPLFHNNKLVIAYLAFQFSVKIYCIYQYALYEIALIFYSLAYVPDYSCFYDFQVKNKSKSLFQTLSNYNSHVIVLTYLVLIFWDVLFIFMSFYR